MTQSSRPTPEIPRIPVPYGNRETLGNILDTVDAPIYNIRLYMLPWRDVVEGRFTSDTEVVIAQTGVTGLLLDDVEIELFALPMQSFEPRRVTMTITEPSGVQFLDQLTSARAALGYRPEAATIPVYLEIVFKGYDPETGQFIEVAGPYRNRLEITKLSFRIDTTGAVYDLTCVTQNSVGQTDFYNKAPKEIETRGATIREHLTSFIDALTTIENENHVSHQVKDEFEIDLSALEENFREMLDENLNYDNFNFLEFARLTNPELRDLSSEEFEERVRSGRIDSSVTNQQQLGRDVRARQLELARTDATNASTFVDQAVATANRARLRAQQSIGSFRNSLGSENLTPISIKRNTSYEFYMFSLFSIEPKFFELVFGTEVANNPGQAARTELVNRLVLTTTVTLLDYDPGRRTFARKVTYIPHLVRNNFENHALSSNDNSGLTNDQMQLRFEQLPLDKFYSYMFTGLNDQILDLDLSYNTGHAILLSPYGGASHRVDVGIANPTNASTSDEATQEIVQLRQSQAGNSLSHESGTQSQLSGTVYLEDILEPATVGPISQRYEVGPSSQPAGASDESASAPSQVRSNRLAMLYTNQTEEVANFLQRQELKLRGDPYYLGRPNITNVEEESSIETPVVGTGLRRSGGIPFAPEFAGFGPRDNISVRGAASHYLLELQLPRTLTQDEDDSTGLRNIQSRSHFLTGVYMIVKAKNTFSDGVFTTTVSGVRQAAFDFSNWQETVAQSDQSFAEAARRNEPIPAPQLEVRDEDSQPIQGVNPNAGNSSAVRSVRNNNPGNIRATNIPWQGKTGNDGEFEIFDTQENGGRALMRNLRTRVEGLGSNATMASVITAWAPPNENPTAEYIAFVTRETGIPGTQVLDWSNSAQMTALARAIAIKEGGRSAIPDDWKNPLWWNARYRAANSDRATVLGVV
jgi:hypothetical protein